jgi:MFS family permease
VVNSSSEGSAPPAGRVVRFLRRISPFHFFAEPEDKIPGDIHRDLQYSVQEGALSGVMAVFNGGVILTGFALALGANEFVIGLIAAVQAGANLLQLRAFRVLERRGNRKSMSVRFAMISRVIWIPVCFLAFLPDSPLRVWAFVALFAASVGLGIFSSVPWISWLVDVVPERVRGRFFAQRNIAAGAVGIVLGIGAGKFVDFWTDAAIGPPLFAFSVLIAIGALFGFRAVGCMRKMVEPQMPRKEEELSFWQTLRVPFGDPNFRHWFYFRIIFDFSMGIAGTFYGVYMLTQASLSFTFVSFLAVVATLLNFLSLKPWGVILDRFGNKPVLEICLFGKVIFAALWLFTTPQTFWLYIIIHLFGIFDGGTAVAIPNMTYTIAPVERRANYIVVDGTLVGIAASISPLIGGALAVAASSWSLSFGNLHLSHFHFVFLAAAVVRLLGFRFLYQVHEKKAKSVAHVISVIRPIRSLDVSEGFQQVLHSLIFPARVLIEKLVERVRPDDDDEPRNGSNA